MLQQVFEAMLQLVSLAYAKGREVSGKVRIASKADMSRRSGTPGQARGDGSGRVLPPLPSHLQHRIRPA
jgi:hypothetical protein